MVEPEHTGIDWAQQPAGGWAQFAAARQRYLDGRAWDSLVRRLEGGDPRPQPAGGEADDPSRPPAAR
jgi:hypothetical protein